MCFLKEKVRLTQHAHFVSFDEQTLKKSEKHTFLSKHIIFEEISLERKNYKMSKYERLQNSSSQQWGFDQFENS